MAIMSSPFSPVIPPTVKMDMSPAPPKQGTAAAISKDQKSEPNEFAAQDTVDKYGVDIKV